MQEGRRMTRAKSNLVVAVKLPELRLLGHDSVLCALLLHVVQDLGVVVPRREQGH